MRYAPTALREENAYIAAHGGGTPYPGLEELLRRLSGRCGLYIVSNCIDGYIQCFLGCTGLGGYIKDFECEGVTGVKKADNIALIARRNGLKRYIYVGDTASDEESARACRLPVRACGLRLRHGKSSRRRDRRAARATRGR